MFTQSKDSQGRQERLPQDEHQEPFWTTREGDKVRGRGAIVLALLDLFSPDEVPEDFLYEGQNWGERVEAWVTHAEEELENELKGFKECGDSDYEEDGN